MTLNDKLQRGFVFLDGGLGTLLQGEAEALEPELYNLRAPEIVKKAHSAYIEAGADIIETNSFGINSRKYPDNYRDLIRASVDLARLAAKEQGSDCLISLDIGPLGCLLSPYGELEFEEAVEIFAKTAKCGADCGVDLLHIETMSDIYEAKAAVLACRESTSLPVMVSFTFNEEARLLTGAEPELVAAVMEGLRVDAVGVNCSVGTKSAINAAKRMLKACSLPVLLCPNAGLPVEREGKTVYLQTAEAFAEEMREAALAGVQILGGCCGTTPQHIAAIKREFGKMQFKSRTLQPPCIVSSGTEYCVIGNKPLLVGERINPTGKKRLSEEFKKHSLSLALDEAVAQAEEGAQILDINAGVPGVDEAELLSQLVTAVARVSSLPLQLDSSNPKALEAAMRIYNGRPLINSVNGKKDSLDKILPLIEKYGGVVIGLCLDEEGIPEAAAERVAIAEKICNEAKKYKIDKRDIIIDPLTLSVGADMQAADITLEALSELKKRGFKTVLGVSNVSFGLPCRERLNASFLTAALERGLSLGIVNPHSVPIMSSYRNFAALHGLDEGFSAYIDFCDKHPTETVSASGPPRASQEEKPDLFNAVVRGNSDRAQSEASALLKELPVQRIIDEYIIPALNYVGEGYEKKRVFLPQLLMSAEAAKSAFSVIKAALPSCEKEPLGRMILATVKGDIHDIGKNIVKSVLENYGIEVLDLGRDVSPEEILKAASSSGIRLVGLSALMTTTVNAMERTIELLHRELPDCKICVGGAVLTADYAKKIGADAYCADAPSTVKFALDFYGGR